MASGSASLRPALWAGLLTLTACVCPGVGEPYRAPALDAPARLWCAVAVSGGDGVDPEQASLVREAVTAELEATGRFAPIATCQARPAAHGHRSVDVHAGPDPRALVELSRASGADALALVHVRRFDPYPPMQLSVSIVIHSTETGALLYSNAAAVDVGDVSTELLLRVHGTGAESREPSGRPISVLSRDRFARFVCREVLASVR